MTSTDTAVARWFSPDDIAQEFGVSRQTVHRWIQRGDLAAVRLGRRIIRIPNSERDRIASTLTPPAA